MEVYLPIKRVHQNMIDILRERQEWGLRLNLINGFSIS